jgi:hypothetical protein
MRYSSPSPSAARPHATGAPCRAQQPLTEQRTEQRTNALECAWYCVLAQRGSRRSHSRLLFKRRFLVAALRLGLRCLAPPRPRHGCTLASSRGSGATQPRGYLIFFRSALLLLFLGRGATGLTDRALAMSLHRRCRRGMRLRKTFPARSRSTDLDILHPVARFGPKDPRPVRALRRSTCPRAFAPALKALTMARHIVALCLPRDAPTKGCPY